MKLISMTDFVLQEEKKGLQNTDRHLRFEKILRYAKFLKQPLTLGMFVPCDENGKFLHEPTPYEVQTAFDEVDLAYNDEEVEQYKKAKEKVLFNDIEYLSFNPVDKSYELFDTKENHLFWVENYGTIEDYVDYNLQLTESAIKQIGL